MSTTWIGQTRRFIALGLVALALASRAFGTSFSTDNSDIYNAINESGWAIELTQQADIVFATLYTHDINNHPIYYSAALTFAGTNASGQAVWSGDLIETQGPWFGAPFDGSKVVNRKVGTFTYVQQFVEGGTVTFSVDGVTVTKQLLRYTFRLDSYGGTYIGAYKLTASGCTSQANNGNYYFLAQFGVTQGANALSIVATDSNGGTCTFTGDYTQTGRFGHSTGSFTCSNGVKGPHQLFELSVTPTDVRGRLVASDNFGCSLVGSFSAIRQ